MVALLIGIASAWARCLRDLLQPASAAQQCGLWHVAYARSLAGTCLLRWWWLPCRWLPLPRRFSVSADALLPSSCGTPDFCSHLVRFRTAGLPAPSADTILLLNPLCAATWYASVLLASLHEWNGVRYLRYSDLAASIAGG